MADEWTPGAGARTLAPVAGMLSLRGHRVLTVYGNRSWDYARTNGQAGARMPQEWPGADLRDRATFLLALDEAARRCGLDPSRGVTLMRYGRGWTIMSEHRGVWLLPSGVYLVVDGPFDGRATTVRTLPGIDIDDPIEVLDRVLWATREVTRG